jgi:hypothetical protein
MDCCFAPGEVVIAPKTGGAAAFRYNDVPGSDRFDVLYSIEDILAHYGLGGPPQGERSTHFDSIPFVARVPEGQEVEYADRYRRRPDVLVAVPNYYVRPSGPALVDGQPAVKINTDFFEQAVQELGCGCPMSFCGSGVRVAVVDSGIDRRVLTYGSSLLQKQFDTDAPRAPLAGLEPYDRQGHGSAVAFITGLWRMYSRISRVSPLISARTARTTNLGCVM